MPNKILIVDDDPDAILFLSTVLKDLGYETIEAPDGQKGLETAKTEKPDLILLDLMMPHKSGIALLSDLRADEILKNIPVIMVTGVAGETGIDLQSFFDRTSTNDEGNRGLKPQGYVEKPVDPEKLLKLIKNILASST